ncbi:MAG: LysM peptidoglycan-binding domain-containing protein [Prevotella sp.]|nr:LysM peptidoglycan-binding domain-containing protein [Prevotella sp.]
MTRVLRYFLLISLFFVAVGIVSAQDDNSIRGYHKVKRKETIFGISRLYEITIDELIEANPEMKNPDYELKKGDILRIPFAGKAPQPAVAAEPARSAADATDDVRNRAIRLGVMLPLHDINGDGRRMVEYYRGVLMACDSLKKQGISVDVHAWNTPEDGDIRTVLLDDAATRCDLIIGPLYSKQMDVLSEFVNHYDIRLVIPFSINAPQLTTNRNIFQIWQSPTSVNEQTITHFMERFKDYHPVFIDCNDSTSKKGTFTTGLRRELEQKGIEYSLTNLKSGEDNFKKAFSQKKQNIVILNTGRSQELGVAFSKINGLKATDPELDITMFGYNDWLMYTRAHLDNFYKYNTYIPSVFYYNPVSPATQRLQQKYRWNFHTDMQNILPRFAITGFDHAYFFLRGLHKYGKSFNGAAGMFGYPPVQTPLQFERYGNGGLRNKTLLFVHYKPEHIVETIKF